MEAEAAKYIGAGSTRSVRQPHLRLRRDRSARHFLIRRRAYPDVRGLIHIY